MLQPTRMHITLLLKTQHAPTFFKCSMFLTLERILPTDGIQIWIWFCISTRDSGLRMGLDQVLLNEKDNPNMVPWSLRFQKYILFGQTKHKTLNKFNDLILWIPVSIHSLRTTIYNSQRPSSSDTSAIRINYAHLSSCHISVRCYLRNCNIYRNICTPELQGVEGTWRYEEKQKEQEIGTIKSANGHINWADKYHQQCQAPNNSLVEFHYWNLCSSHLSPSFVS